MTFLLRDFFESLIIITFGGMFILAEASLRKAKNDFKKIEIIQVTCFLFRLVASFFFSLAALLVGTHLQYYVHLFDYYWEHLIVLLLTTSLITVLILLFGRILPRYFAQAHSSWGLVHCIDKLSECFIHGITPFLSCLDALVSRLLGLVGLSLDKDGAASNEEVIQMMDEGLHTGVFNASEREMVEGVLELDEQTASSLMTPRSHVVFLNLEDEDETNWCRIISSGHSEFPVFQGNHDDIVGIVSVKALWANLSMVGSAKLADLITPPLYVFSHMTASNIIEEFRRKKHHTALVVDEFGVIEGIITLKDVIESILGVLPEREVKGYYPEIKKQSDGTWLVDAMLHYEEACKKLGLPAPQDHEEKRYHTIGGFVLHQLGHIPRIGESIVVDHCYLQVFSMTRHRIDKLRVMVKNP